jgi:hypothetical protein
VWLGVLVVEVFEPPGRCENTDIAGAGTLGVELLDLL